MSLDSICHSAEPLDREHYRHFDDNPVKLVAEQPVSTFSIDVDTAAYSNVRRYLQEGLLPPSDAVRTEELINYFDYGYPTPDSREQPFAVTTEIAPAPWNQEAHLLTVGIRGYDVPPEARPAANLVFLVDVSGSMSSAICRLPATVSPSPWLKKLTPDAPTPPAVG